MTAKKVLLLGGTGAIGVYVASASSSLGYEVHTTSRSSRRQNGIVYHQGNAKDIQWLESLLRNEKFDAIIDFMVYGTEEFKSRISTLLCNTGHYVFLSSYRVYANSNGIALSEEAERLIDCSEDEEFLATDEYALAKGRQEDILYSNSLKNWTIVRPSITYSEERFQFGCLEANTILSRAEESLPVVIPKEMLQVHTTMTWAGDAGLMIAKLLFNADAFCSAFNVCSSESVTWGRVGELYREYIGLEVMPVSMESYLSLGLNPYQVKYDRMFDRYCSNEKVLSVTGVNSSELMSLEAGLKQELSKSVKVVSFSSMTRIHGRMDRITGVQRLFAARSLKECLKYLSGYISFINYIIARFRLSKSLPRYKSTA